MKRLLQRALGSLCLVLFTTLAWAVPQLIVPFDTGGRKLSPNLPLASEAIPVQFNRKEMLALRYLDEVAFTLPNGNVHPFVFELAEDHGGGVNSWTGKHKDFGNQYRAIVTSGPGGSFGVVSTPAGEFRLVPGSGFDWLVDVAAEPSFSQPIEAGDDVRISPQESPQTLRQYAPEAYVPVAGVNSLPMTKAAPTSGSVVDIMFVITNALSAKLSTNLVTRLQFLVARANASYADSDVAIRLRMVHHVVVNYTDASNTGVALAEITPACIVRVAPGGFCDANFNAAVFGGIEALRTTHGADLVALLQDGSNTGGDGVAWLGSRNGASTTITNPTFMYSATTGCVLSCESLFIHEAGHNMGLDHDRATNAFQGGGEPFPPSTQYNFGYYYCASGALACNPELTNGTPGACGGAAGQPECSTNNPANFSDLMSYFQGTTVKNYKFSSPMITCQGQPSQAPQVCGTANADGARYLNEVRAALSAIRGTPTTYTDGTSSVTGWPPSATMPAGFTSTGNAWTVSTDRFFEGTHSLGSARVYAPAIGSLPFPPSTFENSDLGFTGTFSAGTLSFVYNVSSRVRFGTGYGLLEFSIDNVVVLADAGESGWQFFSYPITAGNHTLRWRFKNAIPSNFPPCNDAFWVNPVSATTCSDRAWIDSVSLPVVPATLATPTITLGSSVNPSLLSQTVTFTASVGGSAGAVTGSVQFLNGAAVIAGCSAVAISSGSAACATSALAAGTHTITAVYSGNSAYSALTSSPVTQVVTSGPQLLSANPATLDFGGQSMNTTAPAQTTTIANTSGGPLTVTSVVAPTGYSIVSNNCTLLLAAGTCQVQIVFTPGAAGTVAGVLAVSHSGGTPATVALTGVGERSLVTHYYRSILRRAPDAPGKTFWEAEAARVAGLGANVNETWYSMAMSFYFGAEYALFNRDNNGFVTDLYNTFFNRAPDSAGFNFWLTQMAGGMPREGVLANFMFSPEFSSFTQAIFGNTTARGEVNVVVDFYRGLLSRLPDSAGFNFYVRQFRTAQCQGAGQVLTQVENISSGYANSTEYALRGRTNLQYVADLYNAFLRRGPDLGGIQFWTNQITTGARTREQVRQEFKVSPEFNLRVNAILGETCVP